MLADNSSALFCFFIFEEIAAAVEAMCTYFLFWQAYGIYKSLDLVVQVFIRVAFKILNYSARNKFKVAF